MQLMGKIHQMKSVVFGMTTKAFEYDATRIIADINADFNAINIFFDDGDRLSLHQDMVDSFDETEEGLRILMKDGEEIIFTPF